MSYNGSGTFVINTSGQPVITGTVISSTAFNALTADLGTGLSTAITKDGQTTTTAKIPFAFGLSAAVASNFAAGTAAAPAIYLSTDTGTGLYRIGLNNDGFAINGTKLLDLSAARFVVTGSTGILKNGGTGTAAGLHLDGGGSATTFNIDYGQSASRLYMRQAYADGSGNVTYQYSADGTMGSPIDVLNILWGGGITVNGATTGYGGTGATSNFKTSAAAWTLGLNNANATTCYGLGIKYTAATPNAGGSEFAYWEDATAVRFSVKSNGGINNYSANNTNLSDERVKKDIVAIDLDDLWIKNKALQYVTYLYKDQTDSILNHGLIAQQVKSVAPEFVDTTGFGETPEDGIPLKGLWETDIFYMFGAVLQKAQLRIEELEAKLAKLEAA